MEEADGPDADEVARAWNEAAHHLEVARRLGEEVPGRGDLLRVARAVAGTARRLRPRCCSATSRSTSRWASCPPERIDRDIPRLRALLAGGQPTLMLCDNEGQLERLEELLERRAPGGRTPRWRWARSTAAS